MDVPLSQEHISIVSTTLQTLRRADIKSLAVELGLYHNTIEGYELPGLDDLRRTLIGDWINERDSVRDRGGATWNSLLRSLKTLGQNGIHRNIEEQIEYGKLVSPVIIRQPSQQLDVVPKTESTFSVTARYSVTYQWQKDFVDIPGADSRHYSIKSTTEEDEGKYVCIVRNDAGKVTSTAARLTMLKPPIIEQSPGNMLNIVPGTEATLSVSASGLNLKYEWKKNEVTIPEATSNTHSILNTALVDEGAYTCVVSNDAGKVTSTIALLTVLKLPRIYTPPTSMLNVIPQQQTTLSITASGFNLSYQWMKNRINIPGETSTLYSILKTTDDDEGEYQCIVSNEVGNVISDAVKLTVLKPPTVVTSPKKVNIAVPDDEAKLSVTASGIDIQYQWKMNGEEISGANSSTYTIQKATAENEGVYQCVVSNGAGEVTSDTAQLTVLKPPIIKESPVSKIKCVPRKEATLSVTASGNILHYQWQKDAADIPGATSRTYSISETTVSDEGEYQCIVSNDAGDVTSDAAQITVLKPPVIEDTPASLHNVVPGREAKLSVTARGDNLKYQWLKNGERLPNATSSTLSLSKLAVDDEGEYQCIVSNEAGEKHSDVAQLTLLKPPIIENLPTKLNMTNITPGTEVTLSVSASGENLKYQWKKSGEDISSANSNTYSILKAAYDDEGEYQCVVSNDAGADTSDAIRLTVLKAPIISLHPSDMVLSIIGKKVVLSVSARGHDLKYQWQRKCTDITGTTSDTFEVLRFTEEDGGAYHCTVSNDITGETSCTLAIFGISAKHEGTYRCIMSNDAGTATSGISRLSILKAPNIIQHPKNVINIVPGKPAELLVHVSGFYLKYQWKRNGEDILHATSEVYKIPKAVSTDEGKYQCVISNDAGAVISDAAELTVLKPPVIDCSLLNMINVIPQKQATMSISASGSNLRYQWRKNTVAIPDATSSTFSIEPVITSDDEGDYDCVVSNDAGDVTSNAARLTVLKPPVIDRQPANVIDVRAGQQTELSVSARGIDLKYQWQKNGTDILGETATAYSLLNTTIDDEGQYRCIVRNGAGIVTSDTAELTVLKCPIIETHPANLFNTVPGIKAELIVSAKGSDLKYQWMKEAVPIPGAISSTHVIKLVSEEHAGDYHCVVSNDAGEAASNVVQLTLLKPPVIIDSPTGITNIVPQAEVTLSVRANGQSLKYQWKRNSVSVAGATSSAYTIAAVTLEDEGEYHCVVSNSIGDATSNTAKLTVLRPPQINKHPINAVDITAGKEVKLSVCASGDNLQYQWQKDKVPIPNETLSTFTIINIAVEDEGEYCCVVSNDAGDEISDTARLTLLKQPVIIRHPINMTDVAPGSKRELSVSAHGHNLRYQWRKNIIKIKGATSSTYTIESVTEKHEGDYRCDVKNDAGNARSDAALLTVLRPPDIKAIKMDNIVNVIPGHSAKFSVSTTGLNLKYQWLKNGNAIPGAFSDTYTISKIGADDEGEYQCVVSNDAGEKVSSVGELTVLKRPVITDTSPTTINFAQGKEVTLSVSTSGVNLNYQWIKNGKSITSATSSTYCILNPTIHDQGPYHCVVSNDAGETHSYVTHLIMMRAATILTQPTDMKGVVPGEQRELSVEAIGLNLRYQWRKNKIPIPGAVSKTYTISNITIDDEGDYQCFVSNDAGTTTSKYAQLTILKPPMIIRQPDATIDAFIQNQTKLSISASGHSLRYQWQWNKKDVVGETSHSYTIRDISEENEGDYQCVVSNDAGSVISNTTKLTVLKRPAISIHVIAENQALLSVSNCSSYDGFTFQWKRDSTQIEGANSQEYPISKVTEDHEGEYQCIVTNPNGGSVVSSTAALLLLRTPSITSQPCDVNEMVPGKTTTLSVCASGIGLRYQWKKNSQNLPGATSSAYNIERTTEEDEGEYQCVISNDAGHVTSDRARLIMMKPPQILTHPSDNEDITPGSQVRLSVTASGVGVKYQWKKNAQNIPGETSSNLIMYDILERDQGEYRCEVSNEVGKKLSNSAAVTLCLETEIRCILCNGPHSAGVSRIPDLNPLSTTMKDLYECIYEKIAVKEGETIELFSQEGYSLHANAHTQNCKLKQWKISNNELFYVFTRKVDQPSPLLDYPEECTHSDGKDELHVESTRFGSLTIRVDLDRANADDLILIVASTVHMSTHCICLFTRSNKTLDEGMHELRSGDVLTLVLRSPYQCSGPQGTEYGKETYNPIVPQTDKGTSKFFSILKFICSKNRDSTFRSRLLSYLLNLTKCPPMVHAIKLLCENSKLSLPYWVALVEGCYQLFRSFLTDLPQTTSTGVKDEEVFEFSDYFWGLIIHKSQTYTNETIVYKKQTLVCPISKLKMTRPVTTPGSSDVYDSRSVQEKVKDGIMAVSSSVLRLLTYHPWDEDVHVVQGDIPVSQPNSRYILKVSMPCDWNDLKCHLIFLPICHPNFLNGECLTFIPEGHLVYFEGSSSTSGMQDKIKVVYDPVKCKNLDYTEEMIEHTKEDSSYIHVVEDIAGLSVIPRVRQEVEPEEAIMVLLDGSKSMNEGFADSKISRMDAAKNFLDAFVMTCLIYKFNPLMSIYIYGDEPNKIFELTKLDESTVEDLKKTVITKAHVLGSQTSLYQAVEKAKDKLIKYAKNPCRRRILCLGSSTHNKKNKLHLPFDVKRLKKHLDKKVTIDAIELAEFESPEGSLRDLAEATGGISFCPKDYSKLMDHLHVLLTNKHCTSTVSTQRNSLLLDERGSRSESSSSYSHSMPRMPAPSRPMPSDSITPFVSLSSPAPMPSDSTTSSTSLSYSAPMPSDRSTSYAPLSSPTTQTVVESEHSRRSSSSRWWKL